METLKPSAVTPSKKLARNFAKVLHLRALLKNVTISESNPNDETTINWSESLNKVEEDEEFQEERVAVETLLAKIFASISTIKGAYAELQYSQSPFDPNGIEASDKLLVSELKHLSELKQCYLKKQFDPSPDKAILVAESKETKGVIKTYEIMGKKLESQVRLKDSEIMFLKEKLEEAKSHNKLIEKRLNQSGALSSILDNVHISGLSPSHFVAALRHAVKSIRNFVRLIVDEMRIAKWDIDAAVDAIEHNVVYVIEDHKCFTIESFVCKEMFDGFHFPNFNLPNESFPDDRNNQKNWFFEKFHEMKSTKVKDLLAQKPRSSFAKFCRNKYLRLVHPKMESSFFGNLNHRKFLSCGEFPTKSDFFASFAEMAKRVYQLHCLALSFENQVEIFQVVRGCRFSDVYMESVNDEMFLCSDSDKTTIDESELQVGFTVVPGFRIGKTVIQCQVYLMQNQTKVKKVRRLDSQ